MERKPRTQLFAIYGTPNEIEAVVTKLEFQVLDHIDFVSANKEGRKIYKTSFIQSNGDTATSRVGQSQKSLGVGVSTPYRWMPIYCKSYMDKHFN